ncbi:hypothetical protein [Thermomonospora umbrina]|uniref:hypothetical protein n=1 Tax=Thermomonospora umbrina TaxID=111806 RepID=UPI0014776B66|nr:hypothetical protein [Thermomonospora umbrina]
MTAGSGVVGGTRGAPGRRFGERGEATTAVQSARPAGRCADHLAEHPVQAAEADDEG